MQVLTTTKQDIFHSNREIYYLIIDMILFIYSKYTTCNALYRFFNNSLIIIHLAEKEKRSFDMLHYNIIIIVIVLSIFTLKIQKERKEHLKTIITISWSQKIVLGSISVTRNLVTYL